VLILFGAALVAALVVNFLWWNGRANVRAANATQITTLTAEIEKLKKEIGKVDEIKKRTKEVQEKLKVLEELKRGRSGPVKLLDALSMAMPKNCTLKEFDEKTNQVKITGLASSHDDVAEMMRALGTIVWTKKGMGRVLEENLESRTARVELIAQNGATEDFSLNDLGYFFTMIDLRKAEQVDGKQGKIPVKVIDFELSLQANYTT
jgi:type IV pilus assembly protein PilN